MPEHENRNSPDPVTSPRRFLTDAALVTAALTRSLRLGSVLGSAILLAACDAERVAQPSPQPLASKTAGADALASRDSDGEDEQQGEGLDRVKHFVVIYLENHSFDNLYGQFPGADGLAHAAATCDAGRAPAMPYTTLPTPTGAPIPWQPAERAVQHRAVRAADKPIRDLVHRYYQEQMQIDGGRMDRFARSATPRASSMGHYPTATAAAGGRSGAVHALPIISSTLHSADRSSITSGSIAAASPVFPNAPASIVANARRERASSSPTAAVTPDGFAVNTSFTRESAASRDRAPQSNWCPTRRSHDRRSPVGRQCHVGVVLGRLGRRARRHIPIRSFQFHHQPFAYFANYADGTAAKAQHLKDETDFMRPRSAGTLPAVSFVKPIGADNEHPGYTDLLTGENHVDQLINADAQRPELEGHRDHRHLRRARRLLGSRRAAGGRSLGPGLARPGDRHLAVRQGGFVDHTMYDTTSILALIEQRWGLAPLGTRDARADDIVGCLRLYGESEHDEKGKR